MTDVTHQGTCETVMSERGWPTDPRCGQPAVLRYPAMGGSYMRLCAEHGEKHRKYCGEWLGAEWAPGPWETDPRVTHGGSDATE